MKARAWTTGGGPKAIFVDAVRWLREGDVLVPEVTTLARLVAQIRDEAYNGCGSSCTACGLRGSDGWQSGVYICIIVLIHCDRGGHGR